MVVIDVSGMGQLGSYLTLWLSDESVRVNADLVRSRLRAGQKKEPGNLSGARLLVAWLDRPSARR
jgi:hypothetical protein